jgi:hypothetical protein
MTVRGDIIDYWTNLGPELPRDVELSTPVDDRIRELVARAHRGDVEAIMFVTVTATSYMWQATGNTVLQTSQYMRDTDDELKLTDLANGPWGGR